MIKTHKEVRKAITMARMETDLQNGFLKKCQDVSFSKIQVCRLENH